MQIKIGSIYQWDGRIIYITGDDSKELDGGLEVPMWIGYELKSPDRKMRISKMLLGATAKKVSRDD